MLYLHRLHQFWHNRHRNKLPGFRLKSLRPDQDQDEMECKYVHLDKWKIQLNKLIIFVVPFLQKVSYSLWFRSKTYAKEIFSIICISNVSYICITILSSFGRHCYSWHIQIIYFSPYDALADVAEKKVQWRSYFQFGSRVLKMGYGPIYCVTWTVTTIPDICHGRHGHVRVNFFWPV